MTESYHIQQPSVTKICKDCQQEKPLDAFHKMSMSSDGYRPSCKVCRKERDSQPKIPTQRPLFIFSKVCTKCGHDLPIEEFNYMRKDTMVYHPHCRACQSDYNQQHRATHLEHYQAYEQGRDKEQRNANWNKRYQETYSLDPHYMEVKRVERERWSKSNPLKRLEYVLRRRARVYATMNEPVSFEHILERDGMYCYICNASISPEHAIHFDHVIPLSREGSHTYDNIKVTHAICNRRKHAKLPTELTAHDRRGV